MNKVIIDNLTMERTIRRLSYEIIEKHQDLEEIVIIGIQNKGVKLAEIIRDNIYHIEGIQVGFGQLDISTYRDDINKPTDSSINKTLVKVDIDNKFVIFVDDVLYTGRTIRAAMDAIIDLGRPCAIELCVLVDRGHRQLPIKADYIGKNIPTSKDEKILVELTDFSDNDKISIITV